MARKIKLSSFTEDLEFVNPDISTNKSNTEIEKTNKEEFASGAVKEETEKIEEYYDEASSINERAESVFKINEPKAILKKDASVPARTLEEEEILDCEEEKDNSEIPDDMTTIIQEQAKKDSKILKSLEMANYLQQLSQRAPKNNIARVKKRGLHDTRGKKGEFLHRMHLSYSDENYEFVTTYCHYFRMNNTEFINYMIDYFRTHLDEIIGNEDK